MYSNERTEGSFCGGKYSTWLVVSRMWIILSVLGSTCYGLIQECTCHLLPDITSTSQDSSSIAEHCRVPPWWLVRQKCFNTVLQHWVCRDTWSSHAAGLTCLACGICAGPGWGGMAVRLSCAALVLLHRQSVQLAFPTWSKETWSEPVKSEVSHLLQTEGLSPMNWLPGAQLRPAAVALLKRGLA